MVLVALSSLPGCTRCGASDGDQALNAAGATARGSALGAGSAIAGPSRIASRAVPPGVTSNGRWVTAFALERIAGDENLTWPEAVDHCRSRGKDLCTETQWQRACAVDVGIGHFATWTAAAHEAGAVVRGGASACSAREGRAVDERDPNRLGLCCERAVAIATVENGDAFRATVSKRVLEVESALNAADESLFEKILSEKPSLDGTEMERDTAIAKFAAERQREAGAITYYDRCTAKLVADELPHVVIVDCVAVKRAQGKARGLSQRIAFAELTGPVVYLGDPKRMKVKERKGRVKAFLPSE